LATVLVEDVRKQFGHITALDGVRLEVGDGQSLAVLGPSGSGKSTLLRVIAGLEQADGGEVYIDGSPQGGLPPHRRPVAIVFQHFALYPHLSALGNMTLGLRHGLRVPRGEAERRARAVAARLEISELLDRRPSQMSGGQRQRVALGRAMVRGASVVLLDEPMSGLDAQLRRTLRVEIARVLRSTGATTVHVTHDQLDAIAMADRIAVMRDGCIEQVGTPDELYDRPETTFVAGFIGSPPMNLLTLGAAADGSHTPFGAVRGLPAEAAHLGVRPDQLVLAEPSPGQLSSRGTVDLVEAAGPERVVHVDVGGQPLVVRCPSAGAPQRGAIVPVSCDVRHVHVFGGAHGRRMGSAADVMAKAGVLQ